MFKLTYFYYNCVSKLILKYYYGNSVNIIFTKKLFSQMCNDILIIMQHKCFWSIYYGQCSAGKCIILKLKFFNIITTFVVTKLNKPWRVIRVKLKTWKRKCYNSNCILIRLVRLLCLRKSNFTSHHEKRELLILETISLRIE